MRRTADRKEFGHSLHNTENECLNHLEIIIAEMKSHLSKIEKSDMAESLINGLKST